MGEIRVPYSAEKTLAAWRLSSGLHCFLEFLVNLYFSTGGRQVPHILIRHVVTVFRKIFLQETLWSLRLWTCLWGEKASMFGASSSIQEVFLKFEETSFCYSEDFYESIPTNLVTTDGECKLGCRRLVSVEPIQNVLPLRCVCWIVLTKDLARFSHLCYWKNVF